MLKTILAVIGLCAVAYWLLGAQPAECEYGVCTGAPCWAQTCISDGCFCIQPGPGQKGFCGGPGPSPIN